MTNSSLISSVEQPLLTKVSRT